MFLLDCTLRDGGYYNDWDFSDELVGSYLAAMATVGVDIVEIGFRSLKTDGFKGAYAYSTDEFLKGLDIPRSLMLGVMVNGSELTSGVPLADVIETLFPLGAEDTPVKLVRIACHVHEFEAALPAVTMLKAKGYQVGFNLMQVADRSEQEIRALANKANEFDLDVLYFADSMGSMNPDQVSEIVQVLRSEWEGEIGIHTHDNLGLGVSNTLRALDDGVTWVDSTVTGMGRGPGNSRTEELVVEIAERRKIQLNMVPLLKLVNQYFKPMQNHYGWGTNPYYYLAGKHGIHPSYVQEMLSDSRYGEEDILSVINHLSMEGGKKFSVSTLDYARSFYTGDPRGSWDPSDDLEGREVLLLGTGPGVLQHHNAIEAFIKKNSPVVIALNTQQSIPAELIDFRIACHPVRLLADCEEHTKLPQPLITPFSMLPEDVAKSLGEKTILDYGMQVENGKFEFGKEHSIVPASLVMAYAFAVVASGNCKKAYLAGFDGYAGEDPRNAEMNDIVKVFQGAEKSIDLVAITPSRYDLEQISVYGIVQ